MVHVQDITSMRIGFVFYFANWILCNYQHENCKRRWQKCLLFKI